jgi:hypothetical protein
MMEEIKISYTNLKINIYNKRLIYFDNGDEDYYDIGMLFNLVDIKYYDLIIDINLQKINIFGNLWKNLYKFKNLKSICFIVYRNQHTHKYDELEFRYSSNVKIYNNNISFYSRDIFNFYKNHQDDPYYKNDLFNAGLNEVDFYNIENKNIDEMIKLLFDDFHRNDDGDLIFKNKFGKYFNISIDTFEKNLKV